MNWTAWTDLALAAEAFVLGALLWRGEDLARRAWAAALLCLGLSALAGGLVAFGALDALPLPAVRDLAVAGVTTFGLMAHARHFLTGTWRARVLVFALAYAALFAYLVITVGGFLVVVGLYAPVMVALLGWHLATLKGRGSPAMVAGVALCFVAAGVLVGKLGLGPLAPGAVYHLVMMAAVALLFVGGRALSERGPGASPSSPG